MLRSYFPSLPEVKYDGKTSFAVSLKFHLHGNKTTTHREIDLDNLIKSTLDACTGFFWVDDSQVNEISAKIDRHAKKSRIKIKIFQLEKTRHEK
jgi:Holliday junction resolvase RusA-like endonuclease